MNDIDTIDKLLHIIESSSIHPLLIFKHSLTCPISARAFREVKAYIDNHQPAIDTAIVVVQQASEVSSKAAALLGVQHESPQLILVKDGKSVWDISHFQITQENIKTSVDSHS